MMRFLALILTAYGIGTCQAYAACATPALIRSIPSNEAYKHQRWSGENIEQLLVSSPQAFTPKLKEYRGEVAARTEVDPVEILLDKLRFYPESSPGRIRINSIANGSAGQIRDLTCLEHYLMEEFLKHHEEVVPTAELFAVILTKATGEYVIEVTFGTLQGQAQGVRKLRERVRELRGQGWDYYANIHNHPFMLDNSTGDLGGTLAPSGDRTFGDISSYMKDVNTLGLERAIITNGFHSVVFTQTEIKDVVSKWIY